MEDTYTSVQYDPAVWQPAQGGSGPVPQLRVHAGEETTQITAVPTVTRGLTDDNKGAATDRWVLTPTRGGNDLPALADVPVADVVTIEAAQAAVARDAENCPKLGRLLHALLLRLRWKWFQHARRLLFQARTHRGLEPADLDAAERGWFAADSALPPFVHPTFRNPSGRALPASPAGGRGGDGGVGKKAGWVMAARRRVALFRAGLRDAATAVLPRARGWQATAVFRDTTAGLPAVASAAAHLDALPWENEAAFDAFLGGTSALGALLGPGHPWLNHRVPDVAEGTALVRVLRDTVVANPFYAGDAAAAAANATASTPPLAAWLEDLLPRLAAARDLAVNTGAAGCPSADDRAAWVWIPLGGDHDDGFLAGLPLLDEWRVDSVAAPRWNECAQAVRMRSQWRAVFEEQQKKSKRPVAVGDTVAVCDAPVALRYPALTPRLPLLQHHTPLLAASDVFAYTHYAILSLFMAWMLAEGDNATSTAAAAAVDDGLDDDDDKKEEDAVHAPAFFDTPADVVRPERVLRAYRGELRAVARRLRFVDESKTVPATRDVSEGRRIPVEDWLEHRDRTVGLVTAEIGRTLRRRFREA